jgi:predicted Zn-dependent protease
VPAGQDLARTVDGAADAPDARGVNAAADPKDPKAGPQRKPGGGFVVVDEAQNRADARTFMSSQALVAAGRIDDALQVLRPLARAPVTTVQAHAAVVASALLTTRGQEGDAVSALALIDGIPPGAAIDRGLVLMIRAQVLRRLGRADDAVAAAVASVDLGASPERVVVLASALRQAGRLDDAIATLEGACSPGTDDVALLGHLAGYLALAGSVPESDAVMTRLRGACAGDDPDGWRQLALALACRDDVVGGQAALNKALELDGATTRRWFADDDLLLRRGLVCP